MQTVTYISILPSIGDNVTISDVMVPYVVHEIEKKSSPYDKVIIRNNDTGDLSRLVITNGEWQIQYYPTPHTITFNNNTINLPLVNTNRAAEIAGVHPLQNENIMPFILVDGLIYGTGVFHSAVEGDFPFRVKAWIPKNAILITIDNPIQSYTKSISAKHIDLGNNDWTNHYYHYDNTIVPIAGKSVRGNYDMTLTKRKNGTFVPIRYAKLNTGDNITFHHWSNGQI